MKSDKYDSVKNIKILPGESDSTTLYFRTNDEKIGHFTQGEIDVTHENIHYKENKIKLDVVLSPKKTAQEFIEVEFFSFDHDRNIRVMNRSYSILVKVNTTFSVDKV